MIRIKYNAVLSMMNISTPHIMILLMLSVYIAMGNELDLSTVFAVITLVQLLRIGIRVIPWGIMLIVGSMVSLKRLDDFMSNKEHTDLKEIIAELNETNIINLDGMAYSDVVYMKDATFRWDVSSQFKLDGISLSLSRGKLYGLVGLVGSGKSSLLQAICGEMIMTNG